MSQGCSSVYISQGFPHTYLVFLLFADGTQISIILLYIADDLSIIAIYPLFGPVAGGTSMSVTLRCPQSGCGDLTLYIGENQCLLLHQTQYVR